MDNKLFQAFAFARTMAALFITTDFAASVILHYNFLYKENDGCACIIRTAYAILVCNRCIHMLLACVYIKCTPFAEPAHARIHPSDSHFKVLKIYCFP